MNLHVHIEHLVLHGLPVRSNQRQLLQAAVEMELARGLAAGDPSSIVLEGSALAKVATEPINLPSRPDPLTLGRRIAHAVQGGLTNG
jgi:hypothetical protein